MGEVVHETHEEQEQTTRSAPKAGQEADPPGARGLRVAARKGESPSGLHRTASALRTVVPLVQKLLPLLDGNVASAAANLLAPRLPSRPVVDLAPLETSLMRLRGDVALIQDRNAQHDVAIKRVDDQLETMKDALERAATEQREVSENLSKVRRSVRAFCVIGVVLLVVSIGMNVALFLFMRGGFR